jgi:hypothetical protein
VKQAGPQGGLEQRPFGRHANTAGEGLRTQAGLSETAHARHGSPFVHQPKRSQTLDGPAVGLFRGLADNEYAAQAQQGSSAFCNCGWWTKGSGGHRIDLRPPLRGTPGVLGSGQFGNNTALPPHRHDRFGQQGHPALERIKQDNPEVWSGLGNHQTGDTATRSQINEQGPFSEVLKGGDEPFGVVDVVENGAGTKNSEATSSFEDLE